MSDRILISAFYKFVRLPDCANLKPRLLAACRDAAVKGTILLAEEGINGTIAGDAEGVARVLDYLRADARFADLTTKDAFHSEIPFQRLKVRLKREIVAMKVDGVDARGQVGAYIEPEDWNALIRQDDVLLIDARNDYEVRMGRFAEAINPRTESFNELPQVLANRLDPAVHKRVAMYCTGGIRCEKATAWLLSQGFENVYHLRGGILRYLEQVEESESLWQGECFVFDERVTVDHALRKGSITICDDCKTVVRLNDEPCPNCGSHNLL